MNNQNYDIQGDFHGLPYDFRMPTLTKIVRRLYRPGAPLLVPRVFGAGWTVNFAHPGAKWLVFVPMAAAIIAAIVG